MTTGAPEGAAMLARSEPAPISEPDSGSAKSKPVCVRFTPSEYDALAAVAAERGMSIPEVLRLSWSLIERLEATA
jgi:hypothetical protein